MAESFRMLTMRVPEADMKAFEAMARAQGGSVREWALRSLQAAVGTPKKLPGDWKNYTLTKEQAQGVLGVSKRALEKLVRDGGLPSFCVGRRRRFLAKDVRAWRFNAEEVDRWKEKKEKGEHPLVSEKRMTVAQVAELLGVSRRTIRRWIKVAGMPHEGTGSGVTLRWSEVREWHALMQVGRLRR